MRAQFGTLRPADLDPDVEAVVAGLDIHVSYAKLARAVCYLRQTRDPPVTFIATNTDATFPDAHMVIPGGGIIIAAIATGAGRQPDVVAGKPNPALVDLIGVGGGVGIDKARTAMVGDRLDTDIAFGSLAGLAARILVTATGVHSEADIPGVAGGIVSEDGAGTPSLAAGRDGGGIPAHHMVPTHVVATIAGLTLPASIATAS